MVTNKTRRCARCKQDKAVDQFWFIKSVGHFLSYCKPCHREYNREHYRKNYKSTHVPVVYTQCVGPECDRTAEVANPQMLCKGHYSQAWANKPLTPLQTYKSSYINDEYRMCTSCDTVKKAEEFYLRSSGKAKSECKNCESVKNRANTLIAQDRLDDALEHLEKAPDRIKNRLTARVAELKEKKELEAAK